MADYQPELFATPIARTLKTKGRQDATAVANEREVMWPPEVMHLDLKMRMMLFGDIPKQTRLTVKQVCRRLKCDSNTVLRRIAGGELIAINIGTTNKPCYRVYRWSLVLYVYHQLEGDWRE